MNGYEVIALYVLVQGAVQVTRAGLNYRTARRRDQAKQAAS